MTLDDADTGDGRPSGDAGGGRQRHQGEGDGRRTPRTLTYTVASVSRAAPTCTLNTGDGDTIWCGVVTVEHRGAASSHHIRDDTLDTDSIQVQVPCPTPHSVSDRTITRLMVPPWQQGTDAGKLGFSLTSADLTD